ncbi:apoptosis regulator Bcl-2-like [Oscarella lobularis]|uniref:apoptosis regulator Bcl-2-like n=1 Tax=Oscarella lobularis TaxID=121494 RepID=UPI00331431F7
MNDKSTTTTTTTAKRGGELMRTYIAHRLERECLDARPYALEATIVASPLFAKICALADEVEYRYVVSYDDMCTGDVKREQFAVVVTDLFRSGVVWGRVMALFAYVGAVAVQCRQTNQEAVVERLGAWTDDVFRGRLGRWIDAQPRGWDTIVDHFRKPVPTIVSSTTSIHWTASVLLAVVGLGSVAVILATLQAFCSL